MCCWTVVIGLVREMQSSSESILLASIYPLIVSKRRAKSLPCLESSGLIETAMGSAQCNLLRTLSTLRGPMAAAQQDKASRSEQQTAGATEGPHSGRQRMGCSFPTSY